MPDVMCSCDGPPHVYTRSWCGPAPKQARNSGSVSCPPTDTGIVTRSAPEPSATPARQGFDVQAANEFYEYLVETAASSVAQERGAPVSAAAADVQGVDRDWTIRTTGEVRHAAGEVWAALNEGDFDRWIAAHDAETLAKRPNLAAAELAVKKSLLVYFGVRNPRLPHVAVQAVLSAFPDEPAPREADIEGFAVELFEMSHGPSFDDTPAGMDEARQTARRLVSTHWNLAPDAPDLGTLTRKGVARAIDPSAWLHDEYTGLQASALSAADRVLRLIRQSRA